MTPVFIRNIAYDATEDDVVVAFHYAGIMAENVKIVRDRETRQSKGYGFADIPEDQFERTQQGRIEVLGRRVYLEPKKAVGAR